MFRIFLCWLGKHTWVVSHKKEIQYIVPDFVYMYPTIFSNFSNTVLKGVPNEVNLKIKKCLYCNKENREILK